VLGVVLAQSCKTYEQGVEALRSEAARAGATGLVDVAPNVDWERSMEVAGGSAGPAARGAAGKAVCPKATAVRFK
jgi:hypothetical protein